MKSYTSGFINILFFILTIINPIHATDIKQEFRGVWVASVANLDWPASNKLTVEEQKQSLVDLFKKLAKLNFNAIVFQVRPECDALYNSPYEPWSYWLTGKQGKPPEPFYDPLEFAVNTAHKFGLELHAWINPYRAVRKTGIYDLAPNHITKLHPEWIIKIGDYQFLNPGLKEVRDYVTSIVRDIVLRYDIDGIHLDDYFYPYIPNEITNEDSLNFIANPRGFTDIADWRRDNVNLLLSSIYNSIKKIKPFVRFGVSPFGIYKDNTPEGISGYSSYDKIYCDPIAWIKNNSIDYLAPQLYWEIGGAQDFRKLVNWWNNISEGVDIFPGLATYKIISKNWSSDQIPAQIRMSNSLPNVKGTIQFRAGNLLSNPANISDSLLHNLFASKALPPSFYASVIPSPPKFVYYKLVNDSTIEIHNLSNYTGKYAILNSKNELTALFYNSIDTLKIDGERDYYLKNISRFDAVNGKSLHLKISDEPTKFELLYPKNNSVIKRNFITPVLAPNNSNFRFGIIEIADDPNFFTNLKLKFHTFDDNGVQIDFERNGIYYFKYSVIDKNGRITEFPTREIVVQLD